LGQKSGFDVLTRHDALGDVDPERVGPGLNVADVDAALRREEDLVEAADGVNADVVLLLLNNTYGLVYINLTVLLLRLPWLWNHSGIIWFSFDELVEMASNRHTKKLFIAFLNL
jgi:hypothetical protein